MNAIAHGIHQLDQILTQLREVVVYITAVEIAHVMGIGVLLLGGMALEPGRELLAAVGGEGAVFIDSHHHQLSGFQTQCGIGNGSHQIGHGAQQIGVGQHRVAQAGVMTLGSAHACLLDDVGDVYAAGASHLTTLAVQAQLQRLVKVGRILHAIALSVGARLLGSGIVGSHSGNGAHRRADAALGALLEVVLADIADLHSFSHNSLLKNHQSNRYLFKSKSLVEVIFLTSGRRITGAAISCPR